VQLCCFESELVQHPRTCLTKGRGLSLLASSLLGAIDEEIANIGRTRRADGKAGEHIVPLSHEGDIWASTTNCLILRVWLRRTLWKTSVVLPKIPSLAFAKERPSNRQCCNSCSVG
jgi:hypothetical protein